MFKFTKKKSNASVAARRLLTVEVLSASNIIAEDKKKGTSDSYVQCSLLDLGDREVRGESFRTKQVKNTVNPDFRDAFLFGKSAMPFIRSNITFNK